MSVPSESVMPAISHMLRIPADIIYYAVHHSSIIVALNPANLRLPFAPHWHLLHSLRFSGEKS